MLIFVAVLHRYGTGLSIDLAKWTAARGVPVVPDVSASDLFVACRTRSVLGAGTLHLHVHLDGEVRRRLWRAHRHPCRRRRADQPAHRRCAQAGDPVRACSAARCSPRSSAPWARSSSVELFSTDQSSPDLEVPMWIVYSAHPARLLSDVLPLPAGGVAFLLDRRTCRITMRRRSRVSTATRSTAPVNRSSRHGLGALGKSAGADADHGADLDPGDLHGAETGIIVVPQAVRAITSSGCCSR